MKNIKKRTILLFFGLFFNISLIYSQSSNEVSVLKWFDKNVGQKALPINNGKLHINLDKTIGIVSRYYSSEKITKESVGYDSQHYSDVDLKYDIFEDEIILNAQGESGVIEVTLIKEKVKYFILDNRKFVNLNIDKQLPANYRDGYYEENLIGNTFIFYIKHYKNKKEFIKDSQLFIDYAYKNDFVLFTQGKFTTINSKSELLKQFPNAKKKINEYYSMNRHLKKESEAKFMESLMRYINSI